MIDRLAGATKNRGLLRAALLILLGACLFLSPAQAQAQIFGHQGGSGSGWIQMLRGNVTGNTDDQPVADAAATIGFANALRYALGVYSNALLIVASIMLLYHLLVMTSETAHQGVVGGKRANQIWAPMRLVVAIGLLVPLASGLNSGQYITLQVIEWGSNMAAGVWQAFIEKSGSGAGTDPTPHIPDVGSITRETAKIAACKNLMNMAAQQAGGGKDKITENMRPPALLIGNDKYNSLCGSVIFFAGGFGAAAYMGLYGAMDSYMAEKAKYFLEGNKQYNQDPGPAEIDGMQAMLAVIGTLESVSGGWSNNAIAASAGTGWVSAGAWFLKLAAGGSNRVSGTDTLPIVMGPKSELIRPANVQKAFFKMAEWIVGKYKSHLSGGGADSDMIGNTVAGRKFVDLMLLFLDQMGFVSGLWAPGSVAFKINLGNSPLAELVDLGHRMIRTALDFVGAAVEMGVNGPQHAMYSAQVNDKNATPKSGLMFATLAIPVLTAAAGALLSMGLMVGIFMPMLPFGKFVLSVMTWLVCVLETMACVPLMALAFLTPYGDGFAGQKVEPGYHLVLHAFLRPVMTIFGLIASIIIFNIAAHLITTFYYAITSVSGTFKGGMYVVAKIAFGMMYVSIMYTALNAALKVMDTFARHALRWLGGQSHEEQMGDMQGAVSMAEKGSGVVTGITSMGHYALSAGKEMASAGGGGGGGAMTGDPVQDQQRNALNRSAGGGGRKPAADGGGAGAGARGGTSGALPAPTSSPRSESGAGSTGAGSQAAQRTSGTFGQATGSRAAQGVGSPGASAGQSGAIRTAQNRADEAYQRAETADWKAAVFNPSSQR